MARVTFVNNPQKDVVRSLWDTPLLRYLHDTYRVKFRYCGLPGVELLDVRQWQDMIEDVIAFEPPDKGTERADRLAGIMTLRHNMAKYGITGQAYCGSFEEIVILRKDFEGQPYKQNRIVTLYNLDFCDEIASKIETAEHGKQMWRFEAIRQILRDQHDAFNQYKSPSWFILMITIRNQMDAAKLRTFLKPKGLHASVKEYHDECVKTTPIPSSGPLVGTFTWAIKAFLFDILCRYFGNPNLHALFFPCLRYQGTKKWLAREKKYLASPMLHALLLCRFGDPQAQAPEQWPDGYLSMPSAAVSNEKIIWMADSREAVGSDTPGTVAWIKTHGTEILKGL